MRFVATLHIRNVPADVVEALKERARRQGRSLNAEVVLTLQDAVPRRSLDEILENVRKLAATIPDPPTADEIVDGIHRSREVRAEQILRAATALPLDPGA